MCEETWNLVPSQQKHSDATKTMSICQMPNTIIYYITGSWV